MKDYGNPCIRERNPDYVILHVGTNELDSELPPERIAKSVIDDAKNIQSDNRMVSISGIVLLSNNFNIKVMEVNKKLSEICGKENLLFLKHSNINLKTNLNKSKPNLSRNRYENYVNFVRTL